VPAAFGLAGASGLNATLPLFLTSLLARLGYIHLSGPFTALRSDFAFYGLLVLAVIEFAADKVPFIDSAFHAVMLPAAAASGAILFAIRTGTIQGADGGLLIVLSLLAGAVIAGVVHGSRAAARPIANLALMGPVASTLEDLGAAGLTLVAILLPTLVPVLLLALAAGAYLLVARFRRRRATEAVRPS
jgi:hypothetical protein